MKRLAIPLASYLGVTIVVPLLNGTPADVAFQEHAVLAITLPLIIAGTLSCFLTSGDCALPAAKIAAPHRSSRRDL